MVLFVLFVLLTFLFVFVLLILNVCFVNLFSLFLFCFLIKGTSTEPPSQAAIPSIEAPNSAVIGSNPPNDDAILELDEPLVTDALIGKQEKDRTNNIDVKIGDGMDIAIHGENGKTVHLLVQP